MLVGVGVGVGGGGGEKRPRFKSLGERFTHIYTYIKVEWNFYLVKKKKKNKASHMGKRNSTNTLPK